MNIPRLSRLALEKALAGKLRELLESVGWLKDWEVSANPAPFERRFDILAIIPLPTKSRVELWIECKTLPRPSQFPYVTLQNDFLSDGKRITRVPVLAA